MSKKTPDFLLLFTLILLIIFGILILASVSLPYSQKKYNESFYFLKHQIFFGFFPGFLLLLFFYSLKIDLLKKFYFIFFFLIIPFLLMVFIPGFGVKVYGAQRWVKIYNISFQPIEIAKPFIFIFFAGFLAKNEGKRKNLLFLKFFLLLTILSLILIFQKDASTLLLILTSLIGVYFLSKTPISHFLFLGGFLVLLGIFLIKIAPYRLHRILVFFNPSLDPLNIGFHLQQALITVGSGQLKGRGFGMSEQKFGFLPNPISDSIFGIFAEETGFLGTTFLLCLFFLFFIRCVKISKEAQDQFSRLLGFGLTFYLILQTFMNVGSMIGLFPISGVPLPFISYGGSAIIGELISAGLLLNISKK